MKKVVFVDIMPRLTALDALRVIFEFFIVSGHVSSNPVDSYQFLDMTLRDSMSFFFVLSGFVCMYAHPEKDAFDTWRNTISFWRKKFIQNYPLYFLVCFINFIWVYGIDRMEGVYPHWGVHTCVAMDFLCISSIFYCHQVEMSIYDSGWYLNILFVFWFIFPLIHRKIHNVCTRYHPWLVILCFYVISNSLYGFVLGFPILSGQRFPFTRVWEFLMGCSVYFTLSKRLHWLVPFTLCGLVIFFYLLAHFYLQKTQWWCLYPEDRCIPLRLSTMWGRTAIVWACLIQYIALSAPDEKTLAILYYRFFEDMNYFSLQVYLTHLLTRKILDVIVKKHMGILWFPEIMYLMAYYYIAYLFKNNIHVHITKVAEYLWPKPVLPEDFCEQHIIPSFQIETASNASS